MVCRRCGFEKNRSNFHISKRGVISPWCKTCVAPLNIEQPKPPKLIIKPVIPQPHIEVVPSPPKNSNAMRILWFYKYIESYDFDNWLHLKFVEVLKQHPGVEVMVYGPGIHEGYPHLTQIPFNKYHTIDEIQMKYDFDVMILNTKSRMFANYNPHKKIAEGEWLPKRFNRIDKPRIVIEEDYHYEQDDEWYAQNRIDLILQRHYSQSLRQRVVPMKWFPFSVDTNTFKPGIAANRKNKFCFAGSMNQVAYKPRYMACEALKRAHMIDVFSNGSKHGAAYVKCLQDYTAHLSCSSIYKLSTAKMFEIMASGSALLTNVNDDLPLLFPQGSYFTYKMGTHLTSKEDNADIIRTARAIIDDNNMRNAAIKLGLEAINARHTHQVRIEELLSIIKSLKK